MCLEKKFRYIFCDLDGTILDDKMRHYYCYKAIVGKFGGICIGADEYWQDKRNKVKKTVLLEKTHFGGTYDDYLASWNEMIEADEFIRYETLKDGAIDALKWMANHSEQLYLVTMRQSRNQLEKQLNNLRIREYFDELVLGKPKTEKKSDLIPAEFGDNSLVIGDTEADEQLAKKIGAEFMAVTSGIREKKYFYSANYYIDSWEKFLEY